MARARHPAVSGARLTPMQDEVMRLVVCEGASYKEAAHLLDVATSTIRTHAHAAYLKLGASDRVKAARVYRRRMARCAAERLAEEQGRIGVDAWERVVHLVLDALEC